MDKTGGCATIAKMCIRDSSTPRTISPDEFAARALSVMEEKKITSLVVIDRAGTVVGVLHLHDLWGLDLI